MWLISCAFQFPTAEDHSGIAAQRHNFEIGKRQYAHLGAVGIFFFVTIAHGLPTASDLVFRNKSCGVGASVAVHEGIDVATVPGSLLRSNNMMDLELDNRILAERALHFARFSESRDRAKNR